jgi:FkbM family methyltransferase
MLKRFVSMPGRAVRLLYTSLRRPVVRMGMKGKGIRFVRPNYIYADRFNGTSTILDVGCGSEAEFSRFMIDRFRLQAFGVDPTRKHAPALRALEEEYGDRFRHLPLAVSFENGSIPFNESTEHESGSILAEHTNVQNDETLSYEVESVTPAGLLKRAGISKADFLKLDLEGAEYELLERLTGEEWRPFEQVFIEFHHHCTGYTEKDTRRRVRALSGMGFRVFSLDLHNYLFYRP